MQFDVVTSYPELFPGSLGIGVIGRAFENQMALLRIHGLDESAEQSSYIEKLAAVVAQVKTPTTRTILLGTGGRKLTHKVCVELAQEKELLLVCANAPMNALHKLPIGEQFSMGDYLVMPEIEAMTIIEVVTRQIEGVLGSSQSLKETFSDEFDGGFEPPLYTRPAVFEGKEVPAVLLSGNHQKIAAWRKEQSRLRTASKGKSLGLLKGHDGGITY